MVYSTRSRQRFQARAPLTYSTNTKFYVYEQYDNGHSCFEDREAGISHWVIIEALTPRDANQKAVEIGLQFEENDDNWLRWNVKNNRFRPQLEEFDQGMRYPRAGHPTMVRIDEPWIWPRRRKDGKWTDGPEGWFHFWDGRIEPFYI